MALPILGRGTPQQAETEGLTDAEALALRIGQSPARIVILLEHHDMKLPKQLAEDCPRRILQNYNINDLCFEYVSEQEYQLRPHKVKTYYGSRSKYINTGNFSSHRIGAHLISTQESIRQFREKFRGKTLVDAFVLRVARNQLNLKVDEKIPEPFLFEVALDISTSIEQGALQSCEHFLCHPCNQNLLQARLKTTTFDDLLQQFLNEWGYYLEALSTQRIYGKADEYSVQNILKILPPTGRAVIVYGLKHGIIDNNPASLPDQLSCQLLQEKHTDASIEILVLVDKTFAPAMHEHFSENMNAENLRSNITVYDYKLRREWPILEWYREAPQIYEWAQAIVIPPPPSPH